MGEHVGMVRDLSLPHFSIGFDNGEIVFDASNGGEVWMTLQRWPDKFADPVRVAIAANNEVAIKSLLLDGLNTETGPACPPE